MGDSVVFAFNRNRLGGIGFLAELLRHGFGKSGIAFGQQHTVLRAFGAGNRGQHGAQIQFKCVSEDWFRLFRTPVALRLGISFDQRHAVGFAAGALEVFDRIVIDREEAARRAIFRRHVRDRGFILKRKVRKAGAEEFDELADNALLAQHLDNRQHEVCCSCTFSHLAGQLESDNFRDEHRDRLAKHGSFSLDTANAPTQHGEAVDHGRVAVCADAGVRISNGFAIFLFRPDRLSEIFEVYLVANAGARRDHSEILECRRPPAQEFIPFLITLVFHLDVFLEAVWPGEIIDHDRVVDHEIDRHLRVDRVRRSAEIFRGIAHRGKVNNRRNASKVLHQNTRRAISDLVAGRALVVEPGFESQDVAFGDRLAIFEAQHVFEQHFERCRQARHIAEAVFRGCGERIISVRFSSSGKRAF